MNNVLLKFTVKFYLKEPKSDTEQLIYIYMLFNGKRVRMSSRQKILPSDWDSNLMRSKSDEELNILLRSVAKFAETTYIEAVQKGEDNIGWYLNTSVYGFITQKILTKKARTIEDRVYQTESKVINDRLLALERDKDENRKLIEVILQKISKIERKIK